MGCPDESELLAFASGALASGQPRLEAHLDRCVACRTAVVGAAMADPAPAARVPDEASLVEEEPGRYEPLGECGRGGQSRVLRVYDRRVGREVALKVLDNRGGPARTRFLREVQIVSELAHPSVVPIHEVGVRASGEPYYTMPLVDGRTLGDVVRSASTLSDRLRLLPQFVQICHAVAAAHDLGVVHRDIKPDNIMLGRFGEALLLDWGLAKLTEDASHTGAHVLEPSDPELTRQGHAVGTPAYMSPEQAAGRADSVDERTDVWSLGAVLFHIVTARAPFEGDSATEVLDAVHAGRRETAALPSHEIHEIRPELVAIVDRAMQPDRARRYSTATELAEDLVAYTSGEHVAAYDYSPRERAARFAWRHRAALATTATVAVVLAVALVIVTGSYRRENAQRKRAEQAAATAEQARAAAEAASEQSRLQSLAAMYNLSRAHLERAERLSRDKKVLRARLFAAASLAENPTHPRSRVYDPTIRYDDAEELIARTASLFARADGDAIIGRTSVGPALTLAEPREAASAMAPSSLLLTAADGSETVWVRRTERDDAPIALGGHAGGAIDVAMSRGGKRVVTRDANDDARLWDGATGQLLATWRHDAPWLTTVAVADSGMVAAVNEDGQVVVGDPATGQSRHVGEGPAAALGFSLDSGLLAVGDHRGVAWVYDLETDREVGRWTTQEAIITSVELGPRDRTLAIANGRGLVTLVELETSRLVGKLSGHRGGVSSMAFAPDGTQLYTSAADGQVRGFDIATGELLFEVEGPGGHVYELAVDEELVAVGASSVVRWTLGRRGALLAKPAEVQNAFAMRRGSSILLTATAQPRIVELDVVEGRVRTADLHGEAVARFVVPTSGREVVTAHADGTVSWWEYADGSATLRGSLRPTKQWPASFAATRDGNRVAIDGADGALVIATRDGVVQFIEAHSRTVLGLAFSADGRWLASASYDGEIKVWESPDYERAVSLASGGGPAEAVVFLGADRIVGAGKAGLTVWHGPRWSQRIPLTTTPCHEVAVDDRGELIAAVGDDGRVTVWRLHDEAESLANELVLDLRGRSPQGLLFAPDGTELWLIFARWVERVHLDPAVLDADPEAVLAEAEQATGMTLARPPS